MKAMALDISKACTGWSFLDISFRNGALADLRGISGMRCGSFKTEGDSFFDAVQDFHPKLLKVIRQHEPEYVVFEEGLPIIPQFEVKKRDLIADDEVKRIVVNANSSLVLQRLLGDAQAILRGLRIHHESVTVETWRKKFLGYGRKAGMKRADYKKAARSQCDHLGISVTNDDQAEAAGILYWAALDSQHLKKIANERAVA